MILSITQYDKFSMITAVALVSAFSKIKKKNRVSSGKRSVRS